MVGDLFNDAYPYFQPALFGGVDNSQASSYPGKESVMECVA